MERKYTEYLQDWKERSNRKPLILRGARQVGKTHLVREFGKSHFENFIELNFDDNPKSADMFGTSDIDQVLSYIAAESLTAVIPGETLIFLDEIQRAPELLAKLRYFYEKRPDIHIIAAGSLLDFALEEYEYSMPVGRVEYLFVGPMDFPEFLKSNMQEPLLNFIRKWSIGDHIPSSIHDKLQEQQRLYTAIGGMPAAVKEYVENNSIDNVEREQASIIQTYQDDFSKYKKRIHAGRLKLTLEKLPNLVGNKLKYVDISRDERSKDLSESVRMLQMARIIYCVHHTAGNALPLKFEKKEKDFKPLLLDSGLMMRSLTMKISDLLNENLLIANNGALAEQYIGQQWLYRNVSYTEPELFYWNREKKNSAAEVDYLFTINSNIVPVEVKAGTTGSLKSLHVFATEKQSKLALRFNLDTPSLHNVESNIATKSPHTFQLLSLPLYMVSEAERLCSSLLR